MSTQPFNVNLARQAAVHAGQRPVSSGCGISLIQATLVSICAAQAMLLHYWGPSGLAGHVLGMGLMLFVFYFLEFEVVPPSAYGADYRKYTKQTFIDIMAMVLRSAIDIQILTMLWMVHDHSYIGLALSVLASVDLVLGTTLGVKRYKLWAARRKQNAQAK